MTDVFVIRNQQGHYWGKRKEWVDGSHARDVMRARHRDEAVNILFELSSKNFELRGEVIAAELSERGEPIVEPSQIPLPMAAEPEAPAATEADLAEPAEAGNETAAERAEEQEPAAADTVKYATSDKLEGAANT